jgi:hypothetical protein
MIAATIIPEPHAVAPDGRVLATRAWTVGGDGMLISPHWLTPWPTHTMSAEMSESDAVLGEAGLHAVTYAPRAGPAKPSGR